MLMKKNQDVQVKKKWKLFLEPLYVGQDVKQEGAIFTWDLNSNNFNLRHAFILFPQGIL